MPHPVDTEVGKRIRYRRWKLGMTQMELAERIGVKFQQVQKYETGANRISASRLWEASKALDVSVAFFFGEAEEKSALSQLPVSNSYRIFEQLDNKRQSG
jgi:transcriptional regulator with XRE-family HTH domain